MTRLRISDLLATGLVDPQAHLDAERVARYAENLDALPPIVVFDTGDGYLVADGYHRLAAAQARGRETIDAEMHHGSRHDALHYAATVGAAQHGITADQAMEYIRRRNPERWQGR